MNNKTCYPPKKADGSSGRVEVVRFDLLPSEKGHGEDDEEVDDDDDEDSDSIRKNRRRQEAKDLERWIAGNHGGGEPRTGTGSGTGATGRCRGGRLSRLNQPRMSLLGKPLNYRASRRDARYRRLQSKVYNFLERPRGFQAVSYHMLVFCMVFTCLALSVFSTIKKYEDDAGKALYILESVVLVWFTVEFGFRLWSSGCRSRYQGWIGRLKFLRRPFCIIDVTTILASLVVIGMGSSMGSFSALRGLRFFQILRMVRMDRRGGTWKLLGSVVYAHRQELITTLYIGFLGLIFASFLVYLAEKEANAEKFSNFADALWWGVITLCTVGYGDAVPITWQGKVIASFCALLGISFFALPAGILGSGFALKVQQQQRQKHMIRRRQPAATLIQSLWRCYAADEQSMSIATWRIHQVPLPSPPSSSRNSSSFKHNASFVSRLPTIRRHKSSSIHSGQLAKGALPRPDINASVENLGVTSPRHLNASHSEDSVTDTFSNKNKNSDDDDDEPRCLHLTSQHKGAIRAIRKLKYFVARKKFREALKPYDVKDVIEQYSSGHADLLNRVRSLQCRLDQILGKQGSKSKDVYASKISLASRVVKVERQVDDIEMKLDQLMDLYMEDRKRLLSLPLPPEDPSLTGLGGASGPAGVYLRPRPILVDKHSSEPNTPISKSSHRPIMHRGNSDVSHRIKKRVTLSSIPSQYVISSSPSPGYRNVTMGAPFRQLDDVVIVVPSIESSPEDGDEMDNFDASPTAIAMTSGDEADDVDDADDGEDCDEGEEGVDDDDCWHDSESAALLRARAVSTEITVTPTTPSTSATDLTKEEETASVYPMDSLSPTTTSYRRDN